MRAVLEAVIEDLRRRKAEGETHAYLPQETIEDLRRAAQRALEPEPQPAVIRPPEPVAERVERPAPAMDPHPTLTPSSVTPPTPAGPAPIPAAPVIAIPQGTKQERWNWLRQRVLDCPVCAQHVKPGKRVVFGVGSIDADIFFCGEAPGADEEIQGEPFVGKAGQLLTRIIGAMGLTREQVYIGNIMNWRPEMDTPTGNRPPTAEEMSFCLPYLRAQIEVVRPKVIVALGNTAISGLLGPDPQRRLGRIRGQWHEFAETPLMPTYHPSYVLRYGNSKTKREIWEDMLAVMERVSLPISEKQRGYFRE